MLPLVEVAPAKKPLSDANSSLQPHSSICAALGSSTSSNEKASNTSIEVRTRNQGPQSSKSPESTSLKQTPTASRRLQPPNKPSQLLNRPWTTGYAGYYTARDPSWPSASCFTPRRQVLGGEPAN